MRNIIFVCFIIILILPTYADEAKKKIKYKKVQEVQFDGSDVDGKVRNPTGSYMVHKRGVDFVPLYKVQKQFDRSIMESIDYLE